MKPNQAGDIKAGNPGVSETSVQYGLKRADEIFERHGVTVRLMLSQLQLAAIIAGAHHDGGVQVPLPEYYECGICGAFHSAQWNGDCRQDDARVQPETLDARHGPRGWVEVSMPGSDERINYGGTD